METQLSQAKKKSREAIEEMRQRAMPELGINFRTSQYPGVFWSRKMQKWVAQFFDNRFGKQVWLGSFQEERAAALTISRYKYQTDYEE